MNAWTFFYIYLAGVALVALRIGWHVGYRLDKYDRMFCEVRSLLWGYSLLWPVVLLFSPKSLFSPASSTHSLNKDRAEAEREMDRLEANLPPCSASILYRPKHDESGECDSEFVFDATEVLTIMEKRLAEFPTEQHGRYPGIVNWLRQCDISCAHPVDVPSLEWFVPQCRHWHDETWAGASVLRPMRRASSSG